MGSFVNIWTKSGAVGGLFVILEKFGGLFVIYEKVIFLAQLVDKTILSNFHA